MPVNQPLLRAPLLFLSASFIDCLVLRCIEHGQEALVNPKYFMERKAWITAGLHGRILHSSTFLTQIGSSAFRS